MLDENKEISRLKGKNKQLDEKYQGLQRENRRLIDDKRELQVQNKTLNEQIALFQSRIRELELKNEELSTRLRDCPTKLQPDSGESWHLEQMFNYQMSVVNKDGTTESFCSLVIL